MLGLGLGLTAVRRAGGGLPALPYDPVLVVDGDSQGLGTGGDATTINNYAAAYVPNPRVKILDNSDTFVTYDPAAGKAGINIYAGNANNCGMEVGFIRRFLATYSNTLYIVKRAASGTYQGRPSAARSSGSVTGSMSGSNIMAVTVGTGANETLVVGAGVPAGSYMMFGAGGANWYIGKLGQAAGVSYTFGATAMTKWSVLDSWDMTEGGLYLGHNNSITNELRGKLAAAMTALTGAGKTPKIVSWLHVLGTNDGSDATTASAFSAALSAAYTRIASDFDLSGAQFVLPRCVGTSQDTAIRAGQASLKAANAARVKLLDMDSYTRWDGIHWNFAGLDGAGAAAFDVSFGLAAGL